MPSYYGTKYRMGEVDPIVAKICAGEKITMEDVAKVTTTKAACAYCGKTTDCDCYGKLV